MEVLSCLEAGGHTIDFGVATTKEEREAVLAQRFRVYRREGYYKEGVREDRDEYDRNAVYFLARLRGAAPLKSLLVGSARLIRGRADPAFLFPCQKAIWFELPPAVREVPMTDREEMSRVVSERPPGVPMSKIIFALGLIHVAAEYSVGLRLRCGIAMVKRRLLRALLAAGLCLHEIPEARVVYPRDGILAGYFYRHPDPTVPVYWIAGEIVPSIRKAVAQWQRSLRSSTPRVLS